jgi:hypothetical protein
MAELCKQWLISEQSQSVDRAVEVCGSRLFPPNSQNPGAEKNPKGVIADDRDFDEDANDRKQRDHERGDKSPLHLPTDF